MAVGSVKITGTFAVWDGLKAESSSQLHGHIRRAERSESSPTRASQSLLVTVTFAVCDGPRAVRRLVRTAESVTPTTVPAQLHAIQDNVGPLPPPQPRIVELHQDPCFDRLVVRQVHRAPGGCVSQSQIHSQKHRMMSLKTLTSGVFDRLVVGQVHRAPGGCVSQSQIHSQKHRIRVPQTMEYGV